MKNPQVLINKANSSVSALFHRFSLESVNAPNKTLFCFFEGIDSPYYSPRIKEFYGANYRVYICGNKELVIETFQYFNKKNVRKHITAFFVDRDFDILLQSSGLYETPFYSIENFYTTKYTIIEFFKNEFAFNEESEIMMRILDSFSKNQNEYHEAVLLLNAWYASVVDLYRKNGIKNRLNIGTIIPSDFVKVEIDNISYDYTVEELNEYFKPEIIPGREIVDMKVEELKGHEKGSMFRGKFEIYFLKIFLSHWVEVLSMERAITRKYDFNDKNFLANFSQYSITTNCLKSFIIGLKNYSQSSLL